jgi:hypothetical protein
VLVPVGVNVAIKVTVGVQVAGKGLGGVGVAVGNVAVGGIVGGGNGFIDICGLIRIAPTPTHTHKAINKTITVSMFQITPALSLVDSSASSE